MAYRVLSRDEHFQGPGPKRILSLDGGGLRGILTLGILRRIEAVLRERHGGGDAFRLCHYFDLIAGTSTGAIIAAALALGMTVDEVIGHYKKLGKEVFEKAWFRQGLLRARYDEAALVEHLKNVFHERRSLGDPSLKTGLLVVSKRLDTGSPWPLGNNPRGKFFQAKPEETWISNGNYPLWQVVRASTAAPTFFDPESITISQEVGKKPVIGTFVDGGVSPHNNPALQAFLYATLAGYRVNWETGADRLLVVSVGTGAANPSQSPSRIAAQGGMRALYSLMDDCAALTEVMMQWMATKGSTRRSIDLDVEGCENALFAETPVLSYRRYNLSLLPDPVRRLVPHVTTTQLATLADMDNPTNLDLLLELGEKVGEAQVASSAFEPVFDLPDAQPTSGGRQRFVKRPNQAVVAVQLALPGAGFTYEKWGGSQTCKAGDWIVNNGGDIYTVDADTFARTYRECGRGVYMKTTPIWAEPATEAGAVATREGVTQYQPGDYLVYNEADGGDAYAIDAAKFLEMYEPG